MKNKILLIVLLPNIIGFFTPFFTSCNDNRAVYALDVKRHEGLTTRIVSKVVGQPVIVFYSINEQYAKSSINVISGEQHIPFTDQNSYIKVEEKYIQDNKLTIDIQTSRVGAAEIIEPSGDIQSQECKLVDGDGELKYEGFSYHDFEIVDLELFEIIPYEFDAYAKLCNGKVIVEVKNLDTDNKTFDLDIKFDDLIPNENISTEFGFSYDSKPIKTQGLKYNAQFTGTEHAPAIYAPQQYQKEQKIPSGTMSTIISGFSYRGIRDTSKLNVVLDGQPEDSSVFKAKIIEIHQDKTFDVKINGYDIPMDTTLETVKLKFTNDGEVIPCDSDTFIFTLSQDTTHPDFRTVSWIDLCINARSGIDQLRQYFGIDSFVGLTKEITFLNNVTHTVRVIGQQHDTLVNQKTIEGEKASLTFMFENKITRNDWTKNQPVYIEFSDDANCNEWENSKIRSYLNNDFIDSLPVGIKSYITKVVKTTNKADGEGETKDFIWLPSVEEYGGDSTHWKINPEGSCYEYYEEIKSNNDHKKRERKYIDVQDSTLSAYWLRTAYFEEEDKSIIGCSDEGRITTSYSIFYVTNNKIGFAPCFCI